MCLGFFEKISKLDSKEYIESFILYSISPVIAEAKPSVTLNFKKDDNDGYKNWNEFGVSFIKNLGLECMDLRKTNDYIIVLVYNEKLIKKFIDHKNVKEFLHKVGYEESDNTYTYLSTLKKRYKLYHCPHELGIFLGIPLDDVIDFIQCSKKKCLACGYWKVFNNYDFAVKKFKQYDDIKMITAKRIIQGVEISSVVNEIKK